MNALFGLLSKDCEVRCEKVTNQYDHAEGIDIATQGSRESGEVSLVFASYIWNK